MTTIASICHSEFETTCDKCGMALIAPKWSEYVSDGLVLNFWSCTQCGFQFETEAFVRATADADRDFSMAR